MKPTTGTPILAAIALALLAAALPARAATTAFFSAGETCSGPNSAVVTGGGSLTVSLCVATTESLCGATIQPRVSHPDMAGKLRIVGRVLPAAFADANNTSLNFPIAISENAMGVDLGGTVAATRGTAPGGKQLLATLRIAAPSSSTPQAYTFGLGGLSEVVLARDMDCARAVSAPINASFTVNAGGAPNRPPAANVQ